MVSPLVIQVQQAQGYKIKLFKLLQFLRIHVQVYTNCMVSPLVIYVQQAQGYKLKLFKLLQFLRIHVQVYNVYKLYGISSSCICTTGPGLQIKVVEIVTISQNSVEVCKASVQHFRHRNMKLQVYYITLSVLWCLPFVKTGQNTLYVLIHRCFLS